MNSTPSIDDLKNLFYSDLYQQILTEYDKVATYKLDKQAENLTSSYDTILIRLERDFKFIGLTTKQVFEYLEKIRHKLIAYTISCINFFIAQPENDGEFPKGEKQGKENKSVTLQIGGIVPTFILGKICEIYVLETKDKGQLLEYLKITRMPAAKKYAEQIIKLHKQLLH